MIRKKFNNKLYEQNDNKARVSAKKYWNSIGIKVTDNPDKYGPDLLFDDGSFFNHWAPRIRG